MNILLISHDFTVTGAPNSLLRQAKYFRDAGHNVDIWGLGDGALRGRYIEAGFKPIVIENHFKNIKHAWGKRKNNYDCVICNTIVTYKAVDFIQRQHIPVIWFIRETKLLDEWILKNDSFKELFRRFYNIYTVSGYAADVCRKYNHSVRVINNAVEDKFMKFKKTDNKKIVFGYIGSIAPVKGVDVLLNAFNKLATKHKNVQLLVAGGVYNDYGKKLQKYESSQIKWLGEIQGQEKQSFFDNIDILVVPSLDEPSGLTVIEGAMYGKPVITTDKTGAKYIVQDGKNGFITKTSDTENLYKHMSDIIKMDIDSMKKQSRKMYLEHGTTQRERDQVLSMLEANKNNLPVIHNKKINRIRLFKRKVTSSNRVHIYFCGIKIASYESYYKKHIKQFRKTHTINCDNKNIVSLGMNCFPRTMMTYWGLKRTKNEGELSYPFDLAVHFTEPLTEILQNNFDGFLDNFVFDDLSGYWINKKYGFVYIHDADCGETEKEKLITRLKGRIKNWQTMIKDTKIAYFILYLDTVEMNMDKERAINAAKNISKTIFSLRNNLQTKIIIISTEKIQVNMDNVFVMYAPLPWKGFKWSTTDRISVKGTKHEQKIAKFCYGILSKD